MARIAKGSNIIKAAKKGRYIPKGKTQTAKGVRPSFLSKKEAEEYIGLRESYNRSIQRQVKKYQKIYGDDVVDLEKLSRTGVVPYKIQKGLGDLEDRRQFLQIRRMMKHYRTKAYKQGKLSDMRKRLQKVVADGYLPGDDMRRLINRLINKMSVEDILDFYFAHSDVVGDVYNKYEEHNTKGAIDTDATRDSLGDFLISLEKYADADLWRKIEKQFRKDYGMELDDYRDD